MILMNKKGGAEELLSILKETDRVGLLSHVSPDGDCLGSMLAVGLALEKMGKEISFFNPDPVPGNLTFLPGSSRIRRELPEPIPEILFFIDCSDIERVFPEQSEVLAERTVLNLDHHISNKFFGDYNWVDIGVSASGEIALELIDRLGVELDRDIATNLYTAILADSGCFSYSNTTAQTHRLAARLMEQGIDMFYIFTKVYDQKPLAQVRLLSSALNSLEILADGQIALMVLLRSDFRQCGAGQELSEGLIDHARNIQGVEAAVLLRETFSEETDTAEKKHTDTDTAKRKLTDTDPSEKKLTDTRVKNHILLFYGKMSTFEYILSETTEAKKETNKKIIGSDLIVKSPEQYYTVCQILLDNTSKKYESLYNIAKKDNSCLIINIDSMNDIKNIAKLTHIPIVAIIANNEITLPNYYYDAKYANICFIEYGPLYKPETIINDIATEMALIEE